jgi:hypothetical protein
MDGEDDAGRYVLLPSTMLRLFSNRVSSRGGVFIGECESLVREPCTIGPPSSKTLERLELAMPLIGIGRGDDDKSVVIVGEFLACGKGRGVDNFLSIGVDNSALLCRCTLRMGVDSPDAEMGDVSA